MPIILIKAQVGIGTTSPTSKLEVVGGGNTSATSALKVINSTGTSILTLRNDGLVDMSSAAQGLLPPRMTTIQRDAIFTPASGLVIFNTTTNGLEIRNSTGWLSLTTSSAVSLPTVVIGTQQWMEKNLEVITYRNGDLIPEVSDRFVWDTLTTGAWCWYNNSPTEGAKYGKLYNWYAVNDSRGLCPAGWHVPSDVEWAILETLLGGLSVAGGKMKSTSSLWTYPNTDATNSSGFAALPGGDRNNNGTFMNVESYGRWWTSTEYDQNLAYYRSLLFDNGRMDRSHPAKKLGFSIRCIRD